MLESTRRGAWLAAALVGLACASACATTAAPPASADETPRHVVNPDPGKYLFEEAIRPGQKGFGLTCMRGGKIERFNIEVIDVVQNLTPGNNAILVRCSGLGLEHSGIIAGMSGSPVYIDGKMIGALAFGWPLGKDPIAGVQPIRQMLAIPCDPKDNGKNLVGGGAHNGVSTRWRSNTGLADVAAKTPGYRALAASVARRSPAPRTTTFTSTDKRIAGMTTLASPLAFSGTSPASLSFLASSLQGTSLVPIAGGSTGGAGPQLGGVADIKAGDLKLEPGSSIAIPIITGDMDLSAIGTVTEIRGKTVYAFGHAMLADGATSLPIATGYIYTIMPNLQQSFKVGSSYQQQGMLVTDENNGIVGVMGQSPRTVPIKLRVRSADGALNRTYNYQLAQHPRLTPEVLGSVLSETLVARRAMPKQYTAQIKGQVKFAGKSPADDPIVLDLNLQGTNDTFQVYETILPIALLGDNPFHNLKLESIDLAATIDPVNRAAAVKAVNVASTTVAPGEDVTATVELEPFQQYPRKVTISVTVPKDTPDGEYELCVGSAELLVSQEEQYFPHRFDPQNIQTLVGAVKNLLQYRQDTLYARLVLDLSGAAQKGRELANIPPSRVALFASEKLTNTSPVHNIASAAIDAGGIVSGGQTITITVDKNANKRFFSTRRDPWSSMPSLPSSRGHKLRKPSTGPTSLPGEDPFSPDH